MAERASGTGELHATRYRLPGRRGSSSLAPAAGSLPRLGQTLEVVLAGLHPIANVSLAIGLSNTWNNTALGSYPLPFEMAPFGAPGCSQYVSGDHIAFLLSLGNQVSWPIQIPARGALGRLSCSRWAQGLEK